MLSDNIEALLGDLEKYQDTGATMEALAIQQFCGLLRAFADDARRLEAVLTAPRALTGNVIDLVSRRMGTGPDRIGIPPTGGDAA